MTAAADRVCRAVSPSGASRARSSRGTRGRRPAAVGVGAVQVLHDVERDALGALAQPPDLLGLVARPVALSISATAGSGSCPRPTTDERPRSPSDSTARRRRVVVGAAAREQDEQRPAGEPAHPVRQQAQRRVVRPLHVVHHEDARTAARDGGDHRLPDPGQETGTGARVVHGGGGRAAAVRGQVRHQACRLLPRPVVERGQPPTVLAQAQAQRLRQRTEGQAALVLEGPPHGARWRPRSAGPPGAPPRSRVLPMPASPSNRSPRHRPARRRRRRPGPPRESPQRPTRPGPGAADGEAAGATDGGPDGAAAGRTGGGPAAAPRATASYSRVWSRAAGGRPARARACARTPGTAPGRGAVADLGVQPDEGLVGGLVQRIRREPATRRRQRAVPVPRLPAPAREPGTGSRRARGAGPPPPCAPSPRRPGPRGRRSPRGTRRGTPPPPLRPPQARGPEHVDVDHEVRSRDQADVVVGRLEGAGAQGAPHEVQVCLSAARARSASLSGHSRSASASRDSGRAVTARWARRATALRASKATSSPVADHPGRAEQVHLDAHAASVRVGFRAVARIVTIPGRSGTTVSRSLRGGPRAPLAAGPPAPDEARSPCDMTVLDDGAPARGLLAGP